MAILDPNGTARILATGAPAGADGESAYQVWLALGNSGSRADFVASLRGQNGTDGIKGVDGAGTITSRVATTRIMPASAVVSDGQFNALPANPNNLAHLGLVLGVTALGAEAGSLVVIQGGGDMDLGSAIGSFAADDILFPSANGTLTGVPPTSGWRQALGKASSASRVVVNLGPAYRLPDTATLLVRPDETALDAALLANLTPDLLARAFLGAQIIIDGGEES